MMKEIVLPDILRAGFYDAAAAHKNCTETPNRRVSVFEIEIPVINGGISYVNGQAYPIKAGQIICGKPGQIRHSRLPFKCLFVHLLAEPGALYDFLFSLPDHFEQTTEVGYRRLFEEIVQAYSFPFDGSALYLGSKILELIYALYRDFHIETESPGSGNPLVLQAISYMDLHYTENITLEELAEAINISPIYLHRLFNKVMGQSPYHYLLGKKMNLAKRLLLTTDKSLAEIAYEAGFSSQSYFGAVFRKEEGVTPLQYRREMYHRYPE